MSIRFEPRAFADHLRLDCDGEYSLAEANRVFDEGFSLAARGSHAALLIDARRLGGPAPTLAERYEMAVGVADAQARWRPLVRLAVLGNEPLIHPERFGEIMAARRGAVARAFTDEALALDWLLVRRD